MNPKTATLLACLALASGAVLAGPIHEAAIDGDVEKVKSLLEKDPTLKDVHDPEDHQCTPLHDAAAFGRLDVVKLLLSKGADVNLKDDEGSTPLFKAAGAGDNADKIASALIDKGAKVDVTNDLGETPLHTAAFVGNRALANLLLDKGGKVDVKDKEGWTPLYEAAMYNDKDDVVQLLFEKKADINSKTRIGWTPLDAAVANKRKAVAEFLRAHGAKSGL